MNGKQPSAALEEAWKRLEAVCRRLWEENSPAAIETQAVVEEFKGEIHRLGAHFANLDQLREQDRRERDEALAVLRQKFELETAGLRQKLEQAEASQREKDLQREELLKTLARKEAEHFEFRTQILRTSAAGDEAKARKMEAFYKEVLDKEAQLEKIHATRQAELDAFERRRFEAEAALHTREQDLERKAHHLGLEYRRKQQEIEDLKASLQASIADLVRQYQARSRAQDAAAAPGQP